MEMTSIEVRARAVTAEERPVARSALSGIGNFFALYGGEHIAATEFVIGALLVTWGAVASHPICIKSNRSARSADPTT